MALTEDSHSYEVIAISNLINKVELQTYSSIQLAIGQPHVYKYVLYFTTNLPIINLYFQPFHFSNMFVPPGKPNEYYFGQIDFATTPEYTKIEMALNTNYSPSQLKANYKCYFEWDDNEGKKLTIYYYTMMSQDIEDSFKYATSTPNIEKLLRSYKDDIIDFNINNLSIYEAVKAPNALLHLENTADIQENLSVNYLDCQQLAGAFYEHEYFAQPLTARDEVDITLYVEGVDTLGKLCKTKDTDVECKFPHFDSSNLNYMSLAIINVSSVSDIPDMMQAYNYNACGANNYVPFAVYNPIDLFKNYYFAGDTFYATVDYTKLNLNGKYYFIFIHHRNSGSVGFCNWEYPNISELITVTFDPPPSSCLNFISKIRDYYNEYLGNEDWVVPEERIQSELQIEYSLDKLKNCLNTRFGVLIATNDIRDYLKTITTEIYSNDLINGITYKNIYARETAGYNGATYTGSSNLDIDKYYDYLKAISIKYDYRIRYEDATNCLESWNGNNLLPIKMATQNWVGKTIYVRFILGFDFSTLGGTTENWNYDQKLIVLDYGDMGKTISSIIPLVDGIEVTNALVCPDSTLCFKSIIDSAIEDWLSIINIHKPNSSIGNISESDMDASTEGMTEIYDDRLSNKLHYSLVGSENEKDFCVDISEITVDTIQQISCIGKYRGVVAEQNIEVEYLSDCEIRLYNNNADTVINWYIMPTDEDWTQINSKTIINNATEIFIWDYINYVNAIPTFYNGKTGLGFYFSIIMEYEYNGVVKVKAMGIFIFVYDDIYYEYGSPCEIVITNDIYRLNEDGTIRLNEDGTYRIIE